MQKLVSIIMPVYNAEQYLDVAIQSVINQTYKNIELILVDDSSKDNSIKICEKYQHIDNRVKLLKNERNCGPSFNRNKGLSIAQGEYVTFIDSDDAYSVYNIEKMLNVLEQNKVDLVIAKLTSDVNELENSYDEFSQVKLLKQNKVVEELSLDIKIRGYTCNKLYKMEIINQNQINFDNNLRYCEDYFFNMNYLMHIRSAALIKEKLYFYRQVETSLTHKINVENELKLIQMLEDKKFQFQKLSLYKAESNLDTLICTKYIKLYIDSNIETIPQMCKYIQSINNSDAIYLHKKVLIYICKNIKFAKYYNICEKIIWKIMKVFDNYM